MTYTKKEQSFLKDLQNEEKLCVAKYGKASEAACDPNLKQIFEQIGQSEQNHYDVITEMINGTIPEPLPTKAPGKAQNAKQTEAATEDLKCKTSSAKKKTDAYLLSDVLATEKYVASVYNTAVFEFCDEKARQVLSSIQQQEQQHGKKIADYMEANGMYC